MGEGKKGKGRSLFLSSLPPVSPRFQSFLLRISFVKMIVIASEDTNEEKSKPTTQHRVRRVPNSLDFHAEGIRRCGHIEKKDLGNAKISLASQ